VPGVPVAVAFKLHGGRALTVILRGTQHAPDMVLRHSVDLADPWVAESRHPYHQALGARAPDGEAAMRRGCQVARASAGRAVRNLLSDMASYGFAAHGVAIVVSSRADPAPVSGAHARAHANEEALYRQVVEGTLRSCRVPVTTFVADTLRAEGTKRLPDAALIDVTIKRLSQVATPWASAERKASLAAWLVVPRLRRGSRIRTQRMAPRWIQTFSQAGRPRSAYSRDDCHTEDWYGAISAARQVHG